MTKQGYNMLSLGKASIPPHKKMMDPATHRKEEREGQRAKI